ncbi:hypothetical protein [Planctomyces sp. SH-PL62]|uniref:hypothetical protein n=1 Tax=Planctomyces sp. SH-PL62 TaxID=1636152 RepID=UPI00078E7937|nr:hypothetical protein [Planctomyces sp. SH-PL62]AMV36968.1 hypothetical protein VT85_06020 [Planctomyces sp. SH-PL62]
MFSLSWLRERGLTRARPSGRRRTAKAVALGFLIATTFLQTGCRSGGFGSGCSLFSPCGFPARATSKILQPFRQVGGRLGGLGACGDGCGTPGCDAPMEYAGPVGVVTPGVVPLGPPSGFPAESTLPSTVSPSVEPPTQLEPLPSARPDAGPTRSGTTNSGVRRSQSSSYDAKRPVQNPGVDLTNSVVSTPASTRDRGRAVDLDAGNVLDNLPPLDLPPEVTGRSDSPPVAPAAAKTPTAAPTPTPTTASALPHDQPAGREGGGTGPESPPPAAVAAIAAPSAPSPDADAASQGALGVSRFVVVDLKLAGGSAPSTVGLGWLAEKGYRTVLDLRDPGKIDPRFIGEAAKRGLRYVSFPTDLASLDRGHLDRFSAELALDAARPLYFFDEDGRIAGALWYIRRVLTDKVAWDVARREAEQIGLVDAESWKTTREYVDSSLAAAPKASAPAEPSTPAPAPASAPAPAPTEKPPVQAQAVEPPVLAAVASDAAFAAFVPSLDVDSDVWQPLAAMLVTGLSFRLAFIGRATIPTMLARTRASLPAPEPRS